MTFNIDRYASDKRKNKGDENGTKFFSFPKFSLPKFPKLNNNLTIIMVVLICSFSYIYVEHSKIKYQEKIRQQDALEELIQKDHLNECLSDAEESYRKNWDRQCKAMGSKKDCQLPAYRATTVEKWRTEEKNRCMEKFENNAFPE